MSRSENTDTSTTDAMLPTRPADSHLRALPRRHSVICSCYGRRMFVIDAYALDEAEAKARGTQRGSYVRVTPCEPMRWRQSYIWNLNDCFPEEGKQLELF